MCGDIGSVTKLHRMRVPGVEDYRGDGGLAIAARAGAEDLTIDNEGNLFIAEFGNSRIRRINAKTGMITTVAGNGLPHTIHASMLNAKRWITRGS